jgi:hypothetical protein
LKIKNATRIRVGKRAGLAAAAVLLPAAGVIAGPAGAALADPGDIEVGVALSANVSATIGNSDVCMTLLDSHSNTVAYDCAWQGDEYYPNYKPGNVFMADFLNVPVGPAYQLKVTVAGHPELTVVVVNVQPATTDLKSYIVELGTNKLTVSDLPQ